MCIKLEGQEIFETRDDSSKSDVYCQVAKSKDLRSFAFCVEEAIDCQQGEGNGIYRCLVTVTKIIIILLVSLWFRSVSVFIVIFVLRVIMFHLMIYCAILYMNELLLAWRCCIISKFCCKEVWRRDKSSCGDKCT